MSIRNSSSLASLTRLPPITNHQSLLASGIRFQRLPTPEPGSGVKQSLLPPRRPGVEFTFGPGQLGGGVCSGVGGWSYADSAGPDLTGDRSLLRRVF